MKNIFLTALFVIICMQVHAQILMTKNATISFHSHTFLENIDAVNDNVMAVIDAGKKNIAFSSIGITSARYSMFTVSQLFPLPGGGSGFGLPPSSVLLVHA